MAANPPLPTPRPDYTPQSNLAGVNRVGGLRTARGRQSTIKGVTIHHTVGHPTAKQTVSILNDRGYGAHFVVDRNGVAHMIAEPGTKVSHMRNDLKGLGLNNSNMIGIEVSAENDDDVTPRQVAGTLDLLDRLSAEYPGIGNNVFGHGFLNPAHKQKTEGSTIAKAYQQRQAERLAADERFGLDVTPNTGPGPWGPAESAPGYAAAMQAAYAAGGNRRAYEQGFRQTPAKATLDFSAPDVRGLARGYGELAKSLQATGARTGGGVVAPSPSPDPSRSTTSAFPGRPGAVFSNEPRMTMASSRLAAPATVAGASGMASTSAADMQRALAQVSRMSPSVASNFPARPAAIFGNEPRRTLATERQMAPATVVGASRMTPSTGQTAQQSLTQAATLSQPAPSRFQEVTRAVPTVAPRPTASIASSLPATTGAVPTARPSAPVAASRFQDVTTAVPTARPSTPTKTAPALAADPVGGLEMAPSPTYRETVAARTAQPALSNVATPAKTVASLADWPDEAQRHSVKSGYKYGDYTVADMPIKEVTSIEEAPTSPTARAKAQTTQTGAFPPAPPSGTFPKAPPAYDPAHPPGIKGFLGDMAQRWGPPAAAAALGLGGPIGLGATLLGMSLNEAKPGQLLGNPFAGLARTAKAMFASRPQTYQGPRTTYGKGLHAISDVLGGSTPVGATAYSRSTPGYRVTNIGNNVVEKVNQYGYVSYEQVKPGLTATKKTSNQTKSERAESISPAASKATGGGSHAPSKGGLY